MHKLVVFVSVAIFAVAFGNKCHVSDGEDSLGCGNATHMDCSGPAYTPYCHKTSDSSSGLNGVCTCERFCFTESDCTRAGCGNSFHAECRDAYVNSIEKICVCVRG